MEGSSSVDTRFGERGTPRVSVGKAGVGREPRLPYQSILMAVDCSDHSNRGVSETLALAGLADARVTAIHVYAARMHDMRFRQMEGGLPVSIPFTPCTAEGKNYRELARETNSGRHDLLVIGAEGLGAVPGSGLGTVCERVMRRATIDMLVIRDPKRRLAEGPIVVAIDGSDHSFGGLTTALALAQSWGVPLQVVAAYDPYFHYVAFNRISRVLSEEASRTFRFKEQERLHEEIIDAGLAKIYRAHLDIARSIAAESGATIETLLLDGKPHAAIEKHLRAVQPSLLVIGALGIHADADLDIGGNAERLLRNVECAVLLSRRSHRPRIDTVAAVTTTWTAEAERRMERVPEFARKMARMAILQYAQERGHTVITENIVEEATARLCPGHAPKATGAGNKAGDAGAGNEDPGASGQR